MEDNDIKKGKQAEINQIKIISKKANFQAEDIRGARIKQRINLQP